MLEQLSAGDEAGLVTPDHWPLAVAATLIGWGEDPHATDGHEVCAHIVMKL